MPRTHRRTVRIKGRRRPSRAATLSLILAGLTSAFVFVIWRLWRGDEEPVAYVRTIYDTELTWRCDAGHLFEGLGQVEPRHCWKCGKPAYPVTDYRCPQHGNFEVSVRFAERPDGTVVPAQLRLFGHDWRSADADIRCPRCGRAMERVLTHSFAQLNAEFPTADGRRSTPP